MQSSRALHGGLSSVCVDASADPTAVSAVSPREFGTVSVFRELWKPRSPLMDLDASRGFSELDEEEAVAVTEDEAAVGTSSVPLSTYSLLWIGGIKSSSERSCHTYPFL